jgi:putative peptidoglycan binding protein
MFLASKIGWSGIAFTFLTAGMLVQNFPRSAAEADSNKEGVAAFVIKSEIKNMQETLRNKGYYRGKVDGVLGLQTRGSICEYQKAANLPATGQIDTRTADGLRVRPESTWFNSENAGREVGQGSARVGGETKRERNLRQELSGQRVDQARLGGRKSQGLPLSKTTAETALANNKLRTRHPIGKFSFLWLFGIRAPSEHYCSDLLNPDLLRSESTWCPGMSTRICVRVYT